jgi:hypothetical protein
MRPASENLCAKMSLTRSDKCRKKLFSDVIPLSESVKCVDRREQDAADPKDGHMWDRHSCDAAGKKTASI